MPEPYGVLLVSGAMTHQESYALGFQQDPRARLIGLADEPNLDPRRLALNRKMAADLNIPYFDDLDAALRLPDVHLASICPESERIHRVALRCVSANKHLYLDKPVSANLPAARQLAAAIQRSKVKAQMFSHWNAPSSQRAMRLVSSGALGPLRAIHFDLTFAKAQSGSATLGAPRKESPNPTNFLVPDAKRELFNIAVYCLVIIRRLTNRRPFTSVYASTNNYFLHYHQQRDMEDFGSILLSIDGGITASIASGRTGWTSHAGPGYHRIHLQGAHASHSIDLYQSRADIFSSRASWQLPRFNPEDPIGFWASTDQNKSGPTSWHIPTQPLRSDQALFLDAIQHNTEPAINVHDAIAATEALLAAYRSAATGHPVQLPLP